MAALDELNAVVFKWANMNHSIIKPTLCRLSNIPYKWRLRLVEASVDAADRGLTPQLDRCVKWVDEKLEDWPNSKRMAWDMWDFKHRKDAQKFITIFYLSWQK